MPDTFVLYSRTSCVTGKAIAQGLEADCGRTLPKRGDYTNLVRWGSSEAPWLDQEFATSSGRLFNTAFHIGYCANRQHMMHWLRSIVAGEHRLAAAFSVDNLSGGSPTDRRMFVVRERFSRCGNDILWCRDTDDAPQNGNHFAVEFWPAHYEVRFHIIDGLSAACQIKVKDGSYWPEEGEYEPVIRNLNNGWQLLPLSGPLATSLNINKEALRRVAKSVLQHAYGCNTVTGRGAKYFGAVDFLVRNNGHYKVLEVNSGPGLAGTTLAAYIRHFKTRINNDEISEGADGEPSVDEHALDELSWASVAAPSSGGGTASRATTQRPRIQFAQQGPDLQEILNRVYSSGNLTSW